MKQHVIESLLPSVIQRTLRPGQPLSALTALMEALHEPDERILEELETVFSPRHAPEHFVSFLARWVDLGRFFEPEGLRDCARPAKSITPLPRAVSQNISTVGMCRRLSGGDNEMDTDSGDVVTVAFSSSISHDGSNVYVSISYSCEEDGGNHTVLGVNDFKATVWSAPPGEMLMSRVGVVQILLLHRSQEVKTTDSYLCQELKVPTGAAYLTGWIRATVTTLLRLAQSVQFN